MQYDAVNWYRIMVTKMGFQPDHIILLAEDKTDPDFAAFLDSKKLLPEMSGSTPFINSPVWDDYEKNKDSNRVSKQVDWLQAQQPALSDDIGDFRNMFTSTEHIPFQDLPTAHNFRVARNIVSGLATKKQTVRDCRCGPCGNRSDGGDDQTRGNGPGSQRKTSR